MRLKRIFLYFLILALTASPVFAGGYGHGYSYGYSDRDPSEIFSFNARHHLPKDRVSGTSWSQTYAGTIRTVTAADGTNQPVAANTVPIDYVNGEPFVRIEPAADYLFLNSAAPTTQDIDVLAVKHTVCLVGTGSATISAGTATIAAGGAATDGSPFTVNVTGAGTITVTIAGSPTRVWLTNTAMAHSYVVTAGSAVNRTTEANTVTLAIPTAVSNALQEALSAEVATGTCVAGTLYKITATQVNHFYVGCAINGYFTSAGTETLDANNKVKAVTRQSKGTLVAEVMFGYSLEQTPVSVAYAILSATTSAVSLMFLYNSAGSGRFNTSDAVTGPVVLKEWAASTLYKSVARWGEINSNVQQFYVSVNNGAGGAITNGTKVTYDGAYAVGANLILGYTLYGPMWIKSIKFNKDVITDAQINGM
uniref:Uncharacterized protein n=1 Tax=viral metagenome TaxID=1070528 RepID=A0A6H1ZPN3_9ZZZZ